LVFIVEKPIKSRSKIDLCCKGKQICMVVVLGRAGLLEEAEELIKSMPINPDAII
jgi:pentatricopeptide repeat protein